MYCNNRRRVFELYASTVLSCIKSRSRWRRRRLFVDRRLFIAVVLSTSTPVWTSHYAVAMIREVSVTAEFIGDPF